jgi:hypothetical protein
VHTGVALVLTNVLSQDANTSTVREYPAIFAAPRLAFRLHHAIAVPATSVPVPDRRANRTDRRKNSRSGRRATDPRSNWRKVAWLFAAYAVYLSIRSLPSTVKTAVPATVERVKKLIKHETTPAS